MLSKEQIQTYLHTRLVDVFEVPAEDIHTDARLYDDLDIDSLDAVDMIIELREFTGVQVQPEQFKEVRTVGDVVDAVYAVAQRQMQARTSTGAG